MPSNTLFLGDLSIFSTEKDIRDAFARYGEIANIKIKRSDDSQRNLSYGFLTFKSYDSCINAINQMNGNHLNGRQIRVGWATQKLKTEDKSASTSSVHISYFSDQIEFLITEETIRRLCLVGIAEDMVVDICIKSYDIDKVNKKQFGYGFLHFPNTMDGIKTAIRIVAQIDNLVVTNICFKCNISRNLYNQLQKMENGQYVLPEKSRKQTTNHHSSQDHGKYTNKSNLQVKSQASSHGQNNNHSLQFMRNDHQYMLNIQNEDSKLSQPNAYQYSFPTTYEANYKPHSSSRSDDSISSTNSLVSNLQLMSKDIVIEDIGYGDTSSFSSSVMMFPTQFSDGSRSPATKSSYEHNAERNRSPYSDTMNHSYTGPNSYDSRNAGRAELNRSPCSDASTNSRNANSSYYSRNAGRAELNRSPYSDASNHAQNANSSYTSKFDEKNRTQYANRVFAFTDDKNQMNYQSLKDYTQGHTLPNRDGSRLGMYVQQGQNNYMSNQFENQPYVSNSFPPSHISHDLSPVKSGSYSLGSVDNYGSLSSVTNLPHSSSSNFTNHKIISMPNTMPENMIPSVEIIRDQKYNYPFVYCQSNNQLESPRDMGNI
eukprot:gene11367-15240_t